MIRHKKLAAMVALAGLGVAACSAPSAVNNPGSSGSSTSQGAPQAKALDPSAKGPAPEVAGAAKGGTILVRAETTPSSMDPTDIYYVDSNEISKLTFRALTQFDMRDGKPVLVPDLAEDLGTASADGLTWTFKLKKGIKYQDGTEVKAEDYAYAIKRSFAHDLFADGPTYQLDYFKDGDTYKGPWASGDTYAGVETPDNNTLVIHLRTPFADLPFYASFPMFTPIPKAKDTKDNYQNSPMATGPYTWDTYTVGTELKLKKNPNWDPNTDPVRHQYADAWDFKWGSDAITTQKQTILSQGPDASSIEYDSLDSSVLPDLAGKQSQLLTGESPCTYLFQMDSRKIPLEVRKAIAVAYDYDGMWKIVGNNDVTSARASTILPPSVPGYTDFTLDINGVKLNGTGSGDPVKAAAMLKAAGKENFELVWYYSNNSKIATAGSAYREKFFQKAGFKTRAIGVPKAQIRSYTADYTKDANVLWSPSGWCSDWPSGGSWFPVLFKSSSVKNGLSIGELSDPALDAKIDAVSAKPLDSQAADWGVMDKYILETYLPALPLYHDKLAVVMGNKVGGAVADVTMGMPFFPTIFVKP